MKEVFRSFIFIFIGMVLCGILYPCIITGIGQLFFKEQVEGSIIQMGDKKVGSRYIGQEFTKENYFWGRPSITQYKSSSSSNLAPTSQELLTSIQERTEYLKSTSYQAQEVPAELVTFSASGLDPNISQEAAYYQVERIARARSMTSLELEGLIQQYTINPNTIIGNKVVNVLELNLALDRR